MSGSILLISLQVLQEQGNICTKLLKHTKNSLTIKIHNTVLQQTLVIKLI